MQHNPYAPPKADVADPKVSPGNDTLASRSRRFVNFLVDMIAYYILLIIVAVIIMLMDPLFVDQIEGPGGYVFGASVLILYYLPSEALFGRTLGKLLTRTRTVSESGDTPTFSQVLRRTLVRLVPFEALTFCRKPGIGLHDRWSATRVVRIRDSL